MINLKTIKRLRQLVDVLFKHEMHFLIEKLGLRKYLPILKRFSVKENIIETQPSTIRKIFEELGGGFLKLGQLLALRPDLIGARYSKEFEKLFSEVPSEDFETIKESLKGIPLRNISKKPLGSGSIAQVHKAVLKDKIVAVKIKKKNVDKIFEEDIKLLDFIAKQLIKHYNIPFIDLLGIVEEFKKYTEQELNFLHEASNMIRFYKNFKQDKRVIIPKVISEYSTNDILIMEFKEGIPINKISKQKKRVIDNLVSAIYKMIFEDRFFHADLHPGNILIDNKGRINLLDFGIVGHIDKTFEKKIFSLFYNLIEGNIEETAKSLIDLDIGTEEPDETILKEGLYNVLADFYDRPIEKMPFDKIFYGCIDVARKSRIKLPSNLVLFGKSLISLDGTCRELNPEFNVVSQAKPYVEKLVLKKYSPKNILKDSKQFAFQVVDIVNQLPSSLKKISRQFRKIEERVIDMDETFHQLNKTLYNSLKLLSVTILFSTFFIMSLLFFDKGPSIEGISIIFISGLIISLLFFISVIDLIFKKN